MFPVDGYQFHHLCMLEYRQTCDTLHCRLAEPTEFFASFGSLGTCGVVPSAARCNTSDGESFGDEVANPIVGVLGTPTYKRQ